jgi:hypothetical protein
MKNRRTLACFAIPVLALMICAGTSQAAETKISGTISTTVTLTQDGELVSQDYHQRMSELGEFSCGTELVFANKFKL